MEEARRCGPSGNLQLDPRACRRCGSKLVTTKGHLFGALGERFNIEATGKGLSRLEDDYYKQWPFPVSEEEIAAEGYLKSLTPSQELAVFLSIRGMCQMEVGRHTEAAESFAQAVHLAPAVNGHRLLLAEAESRSAKRPVSSQATRLRIAARLEK